MAVINSDTISALFTNFRVIYQDAFMAYEARVPYERYATVVPSNTLTESYNWFGTVPKMQEWTDTARFVGLSDFTYEITNKHYQAGIEVDRDTLADDRYNVIKPRVQQLAQEAARWPSELVLTTLVANGLAYDGQNFFDTDHGESGTSQVNTQTGTGTTLAQVRADFITARTAMMRITDDQGRPMGVMPDLVIIPPDLQDVFEQLVATNSPGGSTTLALTNTLSKAVDILVDPNLADTNNWFLLHTRGPIKPMIFQMREAPEFLSQDSMTDENAFNRRFFRYSVHMRGNSGFGPWQLAQRVTNT